MLRAILPLALLVAAGASGECELDSTEMVEHSVEASLAIWAADKRCHGGIVEEAPVKCTSDVAESIEELTKVGIAIGDMLGTCGNLKLENHECAEAADKVFAATAGMTAAGAEIADDCADITPEKYDHEILDTATILGKCTTNAAGSMNSFFSAHNAVQKMKKHCDKGKHCKVEALDVVATLSEFGAYIAGAYDECSAYDAHSKHKAEPDTKVAKCAESVLDGVAALSELTELGMKMHHACNVKDERLYLEGAAAPSATSSSSWLTTAAAIPAAAVLSFIAGTRFAKSRQQRDAEMGTFLE